MAERRMFTKKIVNSDAFFDLPISAQALYFQLGMAADDDGFVNNSKKIQRDCGASEDDLILLITKRFILIFDNGVVVIKHWRLHNLLRKDRYTPTQYTDEMASLIIKPDGSYTEKQNKKADGNQMATTWQPNGNHLATQDSIGKYSIGKVSASARTREDNTPTLQEIVDYCKSKGYDFAEKFYAYYKSTNWLDKNGYPIDWRAKADYWALSNAEKKPSRLGDFDPEEAFRLALERTEKEFKTTQGDNNGTHV